MMTINARSIKVRLPGWVYLNARQAQLALLRRGVRVLPNRLRRQAAGHRSQSLGLVIDLGLVELLRHLRAPWIRPRPRR